MLEEPFQGGTDQILGASGTWGRGAEDRIIIPLLPNTAVSVEKGMYGLYVFLDPGEKRMLTVLGMATAISCVGLKEV